LPLDGNQHFLSFQICRSKLRGIKPRFENKEDNKKAEIEKVYVLKESRKKGIGSLIIKELLGCLKKEKVKSISSGIFIKNIASIKLHEKFGFEVTAVRMQKKLP
jgi:GNAT superfamily N-acetyltransferase